jgi:uncharacterized zinc-type alcohol dehydrogenase-like protein
VPASRPIRRCAIGRWAKARRSVIGGLPETQEMIDFCAAHKIVSDVEMVPIQSVNEAYERLVKNEVRYRFVIAKA